MRRIVLALILTAAALAGTASVAEAASWKSGLVNATTAATGSGTAEKCRFIDTKLATPVGLATSACPGVRPGAYVASAIGGCTFNFLFTEFTENRTYAGTAGHCIVPANREGEYTSFADPLARANVNGVLTVIGEFAYGRLDDNFDFALIKLNDVGATHANAQMCHFGGPLGLRRGGVGFGEVLQHYGNGLVIGDAVPARSHVGISSDNHSFITASAGAVGDSGSGLTDSAGRAAGVLVAGISYASPLLVHSRLDTHLDRAAARMGKSFGVMTAPLL